MTVTNLDQTIDAFPDGPKTYLRYFTPQAAGGYMSLWLSNGIPGAGVAPSSGVAGDVPTDATAGAVPFTNPTDPVKTYLSRISAPSAVAGTFFLYDRLWHNSGLSATVTTAQTVGSVALTRPDALGADVEMWWECYAAMGGGAGGTQTASYTNQAGTAGQTATLQSFATSAAIGRSFVFALAAGDTGVRAIATFTHTSTYTSGTYGLVLRRRIASLVQSVAIAPVGPFDAGLPRVYDDACLEGFWFATSATANNVNGDVSLAQG